MVKERKSTLMAPLGIMENGVSIDLFVEVTITMSNSRALFGGRRLYNEATDKFKVPLVVNVKVNCR